MTNSPYISILYIIKYLKKKYLKSLDFMQFVSIYLKGVVCVCVPSEEGGGFIHHTVANLHILHGEKCAKIVFSA